MLRLLIEAATLIWLAALAAVGVLLLILRR